MDPFFIFPMTIVLVSMVGFWNKDNMVKKELVTSEKRFVLDQAVYECQQRQGLTTRMPQDYGVYPEPKIIYVERKPPVKKRPAIVKPRPCDEVKK